MNPHKYEIRIYEGNEIKGAIKRESDFFSPVTVTEHPDGRIAFRFPGATVLEHKKRLYVTLERLEPDASHHLEIFENDRYVASLEVKGLAYAVDRQGRLYYAVEEDFPQVVRYVVREERP